MKTKSLSLLSLLLISGIVMASFVTCKKKQKTSDSQGKVLNIAGNPIGGVKVTYSQGSKTTTSKEDGTFTMSEVAEGEATFVFELKGYQKFSKTFSHSSSNGRLSYVLEYDVNFPRILSVTMDTTHLSDRIEIALNLEIYSNTVLRGCYKILNGPSGVVFGGGIYPGPSAFTSNGSTTYYYTAIGDYVLNASPRGKYYFTEIKVENASFIESLFYDQEVSIELN